ncbi:MAG TPA: methyltransferase domain-containing protein [Rhodocyclaceae bacterium]|nr:methyltransferase domain-containing protein [Rhodocyclaceae bacterium]
MNEPCSSPDALELAALRHDWLDLISQPGDELDQLALLEAGKRRRTGGSVSALQIDCGDAVLALRLARAGAQVLAVDADAATGVPLQQAAAALGVTADFRFQVWSPEYCQDTTPLPGAPFDIVACPHSLSGMPYGHAHNLLRRLAMMTKIGGKLFISAYGVHSALSEAYPDENQPVRQRFAPLAPHIASKYGITQAVCLYSERDLFLLLFEAGLSVVKTFSTTHGNVKAIAVRV